MIQNGGHGRESASLKFFAALVRKTGTDRPSAKQQIRFAGFIHLGGLAEDRDRGHPKLDEKGDGQA